MKAKTSDNNPYGWDVFVYDDKNNPMFLLGKDYTRKSNADELTNKFNSAISSHVAKETEKLQSEIAELKAEVERLKKLDKKICHKAGQCANTPGGMACPKDVICPI